MRIHVGMAMHNQAESACNALMAACKALEAVGAAWTINIADDFSDINEVNCVRDYLFYALNRSTQVFHLDRCGVSSNPNLGTAVGLLLDSVPAAADYYLNLETDVMLQENTLLQLIAGMGLTGAHYAFPMQLTPEGQADFTFWNAGICDPHYLPPILALPGRPKWCNLGCLLMKGDLARDKTIRPDPCFKLWCVDTDYTCALAQKYDRPLYWPHAKVVHVGRQSSKEGTGKYDHLIPDACRAVDAKWASYLPGGPF